MTAVQKASRTARLRAAANELRQLIAASYPDAQFILRRGLDDPREWWLEVHADLQDPDAIMDLVIDRLLQLQVEERLPIFVMTLPRAGVALGGGRLPL